MAFSFARWWIKLLDGRQVMLLIQGQRFEAIPTGIFDLIKDPTQYDFLRTRYMKMDRQTQAREIRKFIGAPDFVLGSVNAITEDGILVAASATANQLGPYASTAGKVILVVGSQKIVPDLETALRRIREYV